MLDIFAPYKWEALFERWPDILMAFGTTVGISVLALVIALALGIVFGVLSVSRIPVLRGITLSLIHILNPFLLQKPRRRGLSPGRRISGGRIR